MIKSRINFELYHVDQDIYHLSIYNNMIILTKIMIMVNMIIIMII